MYLLLAKLCCDDFSHRKVSCALASSLPGTYDAFPRPSSLFSFSVHCELLPKFCITFSTLKCSFPPHHSTPTDSTNVYCSSFPPHQSTPTDSTNVYCSSFQTALLPIPVHVANMYSAGATACIEQPMREGQELRARSAAVLEYASGFKDKNIEHMIRESQEVFERSAAILEHAIRLGEKEIELGAKRRDVATMDIAQLLREAADNLEECRISDARRDRFIARMTSPPDIAEPQARSRAVLTSPPDIAESTARSRASYPATGYHCQLSPESAKIFRTSDRFADVRRARRERLLALRSTPPPTWGFKAVSWAYLPAPGSYPRSCSPDFYMLEGPSTSFLSSRNDPRVPAATVQVSLPVTTLPRKSAMRTTATAKASRVRFELPEDAMAASVSSTAFSPPIRLQPSPVPSDSSELSFTSVLCGTPDGSRSVSPPPCQGSSILSAEGMSMISIPRSDRSLSAENFSEISLPRIRAFWS